MQMQARSFLQVGKWLWHFPQPHLQAVSLAIQACHCETSLQENLQLMMDTGPNGRTLVHKHLGLRGRETKWKLSGWGKNKPSNIRGRMSPAYNLNSKNKSNSHFFFCGSICGGSTGTFCCLSRGTSPRHQQSIPKARPRQDRDISKASPWHHWDTTETSPRHHQRHHWDAAGTRPRHHSETTDTNPRITDASPKPHQDTTDTSLRHHLGQTETSLRCDIPKTSAKHHQNKTMTRPRHPQRITKKSPKHHQDITEKPPKQHRHITKASARYHLSTTETSPRHTKASLGHQPESTANTTESMPRHHPCKASPKQDQDITTTPKHLQDKIETRLRQDRDTLGEIYPGACAAPACLIHVRPQAYRYWGITISSTRHRPSHTKPRPTQDPHKTETQPRHNWDMTETSPRQDRDITQATPN